MEGVTSFYLYLKNSNTTVVIRCHRIFHSHIDDMKYISSQFGFIIDYQYAKITIL